MMQEIHEVAPLALNAAPLQVATFPGGFCGAPGVSLNPLRRRGELTERLVTGGETPQQVIQGRLVSQS